MEGVQCNINKMADALNSSICIAHNFVDNYGESEVFKCTKCSDYESQLREALDELSPLKLVNKLLQKEVLASRPTRVRGRLIKTLAIKLVTLWNTMCGR